jgi:F-type H+-transporting ATPase subunit gamma
MAQNLIDLRRRIKSVKNTQKTTKAMKTVSAAKLRRAVSELNKLKPVLERIIVFLNHLEPGNNLESFPLLKERDSGKVILVAVSADKGLCGAFNSHLIAAAEKYYQQQVEENGDNVSLVTLGNKAVGYFEKKGYSINKSYKSMISKLTYQDALELSKYLQDIFLTPAEDVKKVNFIYTQYLSASKQEIKTKQLFPLDVDWEDPESTESKKELEYIFEPSKAEIFKYLLPRYIDSFVYQILLQSAASEHVARMIAMELATQNATEMIRTLTLTMNKLRQASITKELLEIITATEALRK